MAVGFSRDRWYNYIADRSHPPVASAVVEKPEYDPDHIYAWKPANNYKGWKLIARGEAGVDDAEVIQGAVDKVNSSGGGVIRIARGEYTIKQKINIYAGIHIVGEGKSVTKLTNQTYDYVFHKATDGVIHIDNPPSIRDLSIEGNGTNHGIKIEDQYQPIIENILFKNVAKAITLSSAQKWTEGSYIANIQANVKEVGIEFINEGGTGSFEDTVLINCGFNLLADGAKGVVIGKDTSLSNAIFWQVRAWAYGNTNYGIYVDGALLRSVIMSTFENLGDGTDCYHIVHGLNAEPYYIILGQVLGGYPVNESDYSEDNRVLIIHENKLTVGRASDGKAYLTIDSRGGADPRLVIKGEGVPTIETSAVLDRNLTIRHTRKGVTICLDSDNDETGEYFEIRKDGRYSWEGTQLFKVDEDGRVVGKILNIPTSAPSSPKAGDAYFDPDTATLYIYDGSAWKSVSLT